MSSSITAPTARYVVRYQSLFDAERAFSFPCDARGEVELDRLSDRARLDYFYARTVIGREFAAPALHRL